MMNNEQIKARKFGYGLKTALYQNKIRMKQVELSTIIISPTPNLESQMAEQLANKRKKTLGLTLGSWQSLGVIFLLLANSSAI